MKQQVAVRGLVSLMISLIKPPFKIKNNSGHEPGSESPLASNQISGMQKVNAKRAFAILETLLANYDALSEEDQSTPKIKRGHKSHILESLYALVSADTNLIKEIAQFLANKLTALTIRDEKLNATYFNIEKCLSDGKLKIVEPVHVLFHVAILCFTKGLESIHNHSLHEAFSSLVGLKSLTKGIVKTYLETEASSLFDLYSKQLSKKVQAQAHPARSVDSIQQIQFGIFDAIIEHLVLSNSFE